MASFPICPYKEKQIQPDFYRGMPQASHGMNRACTKTRNTGTPEHRNTGTPEHRNTGTPERPRTPEQWKKPGTPILTVLLCCPITYHVKNILSLQMAATARVIWLCACVRYWPDRVLVHECVTCFYCWYKFVYPGITKELGAPY